MKRFASFIIGLAMMITLSTVALAADIESFSDVPDTNWAHDAIMDMVDRGMFYGTTTPINGVGTFEPDRTMTRAQFIAVLTRYLYPDELNAMDSDSGTTWYTNNYIVALKYGLLNESELDHGDLTKDCSRQEMAMLLTRAAKLATGETPYALVPVSRIADYSSIDSYYCDYVQQAYSMGLLTGVDNIGTFSPHTALNRAQAATVIYRLLEPSTRNVVSFNEIGFFTWPNGITYEGEYKDGEADGYGKMTFPDIGTYVGYFSAGKRSGIGTFTWDVGDRYVGNWANDAMNGAGTYTFSDGYVIRGTWEDNRIKVRDLAMNTSSLTIEVGAETQIVALCEPQIITDAITWKSSNESVLTVSGKGNLCTINAKAVGSAEVTATTVSGKTCSCTVVVNAAPALVNQISLNYGDYSLKVDDQVTLKATVTPSNTAKITWSSSDTSVANVSTTGVVTAYAEGSAVISATSENGAVATCYITVYEPLNELWDGTWVVYDSDSSGNVQYPYAGGGTCVFDIENMTACMSAYPYSGNYIDISPSNDYTWTGNYETSLYSYELTFTSIHENQIILEVNQIYDMSSYYGDYVVTSYYVLYRQ